MFQWEKLGLIIRPTGQPWMRTHAMVPVAEPRADRIRVYFSGRDDQNRSHVSYADLDPDEPTKVLGYAPRPVLGLGELGAFDDNGVTPSWLVREARRTLLYYIGWNKGSTVRMHLFGGLAVGDAKGETFRRISRAPLLERTATDPLLNTAPCVLREGRRWRMWYVCGTQWLTPDLPRYHIRYAESTNGSDWTRKGKVAIDYADPSENALARPCVVHHNGRYHMWFSHKGDAYRIGYAHSKDGDRWIRDDSKAGIDVSKSGWDADMVCYSHVFQHRGHWYMLYNGNQYGRDGIGLAVARA